MQTFIADLLERSYKTFLQAFLATFSLAFAAPKNVLDAGAWKAAAIAAVVASVSAAVSAVTSMLSKRFGDPNSASLIALAVAPTPDAGIELPDLPEAAPRGPFG
jgi:hypothetical protein